MKTLLTTLLVLALAAGGASAATITIVNADAAGEGFNDPTPAVPVGGNPGTTIGQQRLNLFQRAADIWGALIDSPIEIFVESAFNPLPCDASGAVLGSAGPQTVHRTFTGAEWTATWYHAALANKRSASDLSGNYDIFAQFNSDIDNNNACLSGTNWYYGFDGNEGGDVELLPVLLHEMAHGLGFSTFVDETTGAEFMSFGDVFERFILDTTTGLTWNQMNNTQRAASAINTGNLVWDGAAVTNGAPYFLQGAPTLFANSPGTLPATMSLGTASFGPQLDLTGVTGDVVLVNDGVAPTSDGCTALVNGAQIAGNIALIDRGVCAFTTKAQNAEAAGAIAVIIVDNLVSSVPPGLGGTDPGLTIPTVSLTLADGNLIKAELGGGVNVTLKLDGSSLSGADANGQVLLYAPNPVEPGSSISHWDVSANPSLLMEPGITSVLHDEVDLTIQSFDDIGWFDPRVSNAVDTPRQPTALAPAYPNPFNPSTTIAFRVAQDGPVQLEIYDLMGRRVRTLVREEMTANEYSVTWHGENEAGHRVASGVYLYRLQTVDHLETRRMVLLK